MNPFDPKAGIHHEALKIDKLERGHVFFGVATSQASTKTCVGGDKHGGGMMNCKLWIRLSRRPSLISMLVKTVKKNV